jgi:hypothetical protein
VLGTFPGIFMVFPEKIFKRLIFFTAPSLQARKAKALFYAVFLGF